MLAVRFYLGVAMLLIACLAQAQPLRLYTEEYPPINFSQDGEAAGLSTDVVREIMRRTGQSVPIRVVPWARGYQQALQRANTGLFVTMRTEPREPLFKWVGPLTRNITGFYALRSAQISINSLDQARGFNEIAVPRD